MTLTVVQTMAFLHEIIVLGPTRESPGGCLNFNSNFPFLAYVGTDQFSTGVCLRNGSTSHSLQRLRNMAANTCRGSALFSSAETLFSEGFTFVVISKWDHPEGLKSYVIPKTS